MKEELISKKKEIEDFLNGPREYKPFVFEFYNDWNSFAFWQPMNWRNFTWIYFYTEINDYSVYLEIHLALLGFHFNLYWWRKPTEDGK